MYFGERERERVQRFGSHGSNSYLSFRHFYSLSNSHSLSVCCFLQSLCLFGYLEVGICVSTQKRGMNFLHILLLYNIWVIFQLLCLLFLYGGSFLNMEVWICMLYPFSLQCAITIQLFGNHRLESKFSISCCILSSSDASKNYISSAEIYNLVVNRSFPFIFVDESNLSIIK